MSSDLMAELTKEYLYSRLATLATMKALVRTENVLKEDLAQMEKNLTEQNHNLARMVNKGSDGADERLANIIDRLDFRAELTELKQELQSMKERLARVERHALKR